MATNKADNKEFDTLDIQAALYPDKAVPIDARSLFNTYELAEQAAKEAEHAGDKKALYYIGQQVCVVTETSVQWYVITANKTLEPLGIAPRIDPESGHWIVGNIDTGVTARGPEGAPGKDGAPGVQGPPGESGIAAPTNGFFTVGVDEETGVLYAYPAVEGDVPNLGYDAATGELYFSTDGNDRVVLGNVRGPQGLKGDPGKDGGQGRDGEPGSTPYIGENGNWWIDGEDKGIKANGIAANGYYAFEVDEDGQLWVVGPNGATLPDFEFNEATGDLYIKTNGGKKFIGNVKGEKGEQGDNGVSALEEGSAENTLQQLGNTAGAKGFKITGATSLGSGKGQYTLRDASGISAGMKYVSCTSEMNAVGGSVLSVSGNTVEVDGYIHKALNTATDNEETGDVYNYLIIVDHPELGDLEIGYGAAALGDGSVVYAKNGFSTAKNGKVLGKYGKVGGKDTVAGHCARADGDNTKALGACASTDGSNTEASGFGAHAGGVDTKAPAYASSADGLGTKTERQAQHVCGQYNASDPNAYFVVGCGPDAKTLRNAFSAGFYNGEAFIKVGGTYMSRTWFGNLVSFAQNMGNYAKKSDLSTIASEFASKVSFEVAEDGTVYLITED